MFPVKGESLIKKKKRISHFQAAGLSMTDEEIALRRKTTRKLLDHRLETTPKPVEETKEETIQSNNLTSTCGDTAFIAFARVYSGKIKKGTKIFVLGPKHDPAKALSLDETINETLTLKDLGPEQHITVATIGEVFMLMGEDVTELEEVLAGNVLGIGGLEDHILKSATLSSTVACPRFIDLHSSTTPIMRVALEPSHSKEMAQLVQGMKLLNQADPCVQVFIQESGEHVLVTAGEVHLQRCVNDLKERYAKIDINVSAPIVPFRETIILPPKVDMVKEAIEEKPVLQTQNDDNAITLKTANKLSSIRIRAKPLPQTVTKLLEQNANLLKIQDCSTYSLSNGELDFKLREETDKQLADLKAELGLLFDNEGDEWEGAVNQIWSFGPRRCGSNILLNRIKGYDRPPVWLSAPGSDSSSTLSNYDGSFMNGFQIATFSGPLCDEPMTGVCFVVEEWTVENETENVLADLPEKNRGRTLQLCEDQRLCNESDAVSVASSDPSHSSSTPFGPFTGQIMSTVKEACWKAFQAQPQRLVAAMYSCNIQVTADMLGKVYGVLARRQGRVLHADIQEGSQTFYVTAELPVVESFDFANEIRKQTSGMAVPQLVFSHWEVVDCDPFWVPSTEEEYAHFGEKADSENRARKYVNSVRKRKGLHVDEKIVEFAEKQRTLTRNK